MNASVRKWGNSPAVRIPAAVMAATGLRLDSRIDVRAENGRIVIEPLLDDTAFHEALTATLGEWLSPEDEEDWSDL